MKIEILLIVTAVFLFSEVFLTNPRFLMVENMGLPSGCCSSWGQGKLGQPRPSLALGFLLLQRAPHESHRSLWPLCLTLESLYWQSLPQGPVGKLHSGEKRQGWGNEDGAGEGCSGEPSRGG